MYIVRAGAIGAAGVAMAAPLFGSTSKKKKTISSSLVTYVCISGSDSSIVTVS